MTAKPTGFHPQPNFYITQDNFKRLSGPAFWRVNDLPPKQWEQIQKHFGNADTLAVFASAVAPNPIQPPNNAPVGGIDWVRIENKPRPNESALNVDHYVIGYPDQFGYPVYGPLKSGSMADHWSNLDDLRVYFADNEE